MANTKTIHAIDIDTEAVISELCTTILKSKDTAMLQDFFDCLFTPAERLDIAKRWLLVQEIEKGTPQREIAKMFKMSLCKITRGSRELKKENSAFVQMLELARSKEM